MVITFPAALKTAKLPVTVWFYWGLSMLFPYGRWLLCRPTFFDVTYEINPWMSIHRAPNSERALVQWMRLHHTLIRLGAFVEYVEPSRGLPDMVFTANAGLVRSGKCLLSNFRHPERQGEAPLFRAWFEAHGFSVLQLGASVYFEGEGDALFAGENLFVGHGFRTDRAACEEVAGMLGVSSVIPCELTDPRFYHLDTCFCPISPSQALCFPSAFTCDSVARMERAIELIVVPEPDALRFACNAVVLGTTVVVPAGCARTRALLSEKGFGSEEVELDEFLKGGGSAKCLSLNLNH